MLNKLIKLLGGLTREEIRALEGNYEQWRARCEKEEEKVKELEEEVKLKNARIDVLIEMLLKSRTSEAPSSPPDKRPIQTLPMSWPRAKRELERKERIKSSIPPDAQVS